MTDDDRLAALLHESGVGCHPTAERGDMRHHDAGAARLRASGVRVGDEGLREALEAGKTAGWIEPLLSSDHGFRIQTIVSGEQDCRCPMHGALRVALAEPRS